MAKVEGKITAFIVDMSFEGVEILQRCEFMGFRGIENAHLRFTNVKVPVENVIGEVGQGLRIALKTLNTGRISIAALCLAIARELYAPTIDWANKRVQLGDKIGKHQLNAQKLERMATELFAMEAASRLAAAYADKGDVDYRVEAACAKLFSSESLWNFICRSMELRGGRGYEKADSLRMRGETALPVEQFMRDSRMYLIGEGASEILRLFIAREVLNPHVKRALPLFMSSKKSLSGFAKLGSYYSKWYARQWFANSVKSGYVSNIKMRDQLDYIEKTSRRLARVLLRNMVREKTEFASHQLQIARFADIGVELFMMTAVASYVERYKGEDKKRVRELAYAFCLDARERIEENFRRIKDNHDDEITKIGRNALQGRYHALLTKGIIKKEY